MCCICSYNDVAFSGQLMGVACNIMHAQALLEEIFL